MRYRFFPSLLLAAALLASPVCAQPSRPPAAPAARITAAQAKQLAELVAKHDGIDLSNTYIEMNSMDLMQPFVRGYSSFILIREATSPGPDTTLRRYAVNRATGDVWEMTECRRYHFPALDALQRSLTGATSTAAEIAAERQQLSCQSPSARTSL